MTDSQMLYAPPLFVAFAKAIAIGLFVLLMDWSQRRRWNYRPVEPRDVEMARKHNSRWIALTVIYNSEIRRSGLLLGWALMSVPVVLGDLWWIGMIGAAFVGTAASATMWAFLAPMDRANRRKAKQRKKAKNAL